MLCYDMLRPIPFISTGFFGFFGPRFLEFTLLPIELQLVLNVGFQGTHARVMKVTPCTSWVDSCGKTVGNSVGKNHDISGYKQGRRGALKFQLCSFVRERHLTTIKADVVWHAIAPQYET